MEEWPSISRISGRPTSSYSSLKRRMTLAERSSSLFSRVQTRPVFRPYTPLFLYAPLLLALVVLPRAVPPQDLDRVGVRRDRACIGIGRGGILTRLSVIPVSQPSATSCSVTVMSAASR
ncbi:hypothetical protein AQJ91_23310 [Streptomyces dysideae]|uniref:Uncharacterized protein n=1 Tax=Streptomyces dysideae TaxID=909626 RepID=A0A124IEN0_9ACTN|nr:hypothetical protein AQJ91_23310 [Streptomyces dysideae]